MTLNQKNWKLVEMINKQLNIFQDDPTLLKEGYVTAQESTYQNKKYTSNDFYRMGYLDKSERMSD